MDFDRTCGLGLWPGAMVLLALPWYIVASAVVLASNRTIRGGIVDLHKLCSYTATPYADGRECGI